MKTRSSKIAVIIITMIMVVTFTSNYSYGDETSYINNEINLFENETIFINISNRIQMALLFDEEYSDLRMKIILGDSTNSLLKAYSPIRKNEVLSILKRYSEIKGLETMALPNRVDGALESDDVERQKLLNELITAGIITEDYINGKFNIKDLKDAINTINQLGDKKLMIEKEVKDVIENSYTNLRDKDQINFNLVHLQTGASVSHNGDVSKHPASIIKTLYLYTFLDEVSKGERSLNDKRLFVNSDKYNKYNQKITGSGVLQYSKTNKTYTWGELLRLMIIHSDNVATYMVMEELGVEVIDAKAEALELENTFIPGLIYTKAGYPTTSTANDLTRVLYELKGLPVELKDFAMKQLKDCTSKDRIATKLNDVIWLGNKSGTLSNFVGDSAIIKYGKNNEIHMTIILRTKDDSYIDTLKSEEKISQISYEIIEKLKSIDKKYSTE